MKPIAVIIDIFGTLFQEYSEIERRQKHYKSCKRFQEQLLEYEKLTKLEFATGFAGIFAEKKTFHQLRKKIEDIKNIRLSEKYPKS